jgi:hypothetical protein
MTAKYENGKEISSCLYPAITSNFGNTAMLSFSAKDNYSAGVALEYKEDSDAKVQGYWTKDIKYTDDFGSIYWADFTFMHSGIKKATLNVPKETDLSSTNYAATLDSSSYRMRKDSREKISIALNITAKSEDSNLIVGSALTRLSRAINDEEKNEYFQLLIFNSHFSISKFAKNISELISGDYETVDVWNPSVQWLIEEESLVKPSSDGSHSEAFRVMTGYLNNKFGYILVAENGDILLMSTEKDTYPIEFDFYITRD